MNIGSFEFLAAYCLAPIFFHVLLGKLKRQLYLSALNLGFLWTFIPNSHSWLGFAIYIGGTYSILWLIRRRPSGFLVFLGIAIVLTAVGRQAGDSRF